MNTISTNEANCDNGRHSPNKPGNGPPLPKVIDVEGTVIFDLDADTVTKNVTLTMVEVDPDPDPEKSLVGSTPNKEEYYIRVPTQEAARIHFKLSDNWNWVFNGDGVTLNKEPHARRYWIESIVDPKVRTLVIKYSGNPSQDWQTDNLSNDEKFNLMVSLSQNETPKQLAIEIDPITKNPPPVGGRKKLSTPGPLL